MPPQPVHVEVVPQLRGCGAAVVAVQMAAWTAPASAASANARRAQVRDLRTRRIGRGPASLGQRGELPLRIRDAGGRVVGARAAAGDIARHRDDLVDPDRIAGFAVGIEHLAIDGHREIRERATEPIAAVQRADHPASCRTQQRASACRFLGILYLVHPPLDPGARRLKRARAEHIQRRGLAAQPHDRDDEGGQPGEDHQYGDRGDDADPPVPGPRRSLSSAQVHGVLSTSTWRYKVTLSVLASVSWRVSSTSPAPTAEALLASSRVPAQLTLIARRLLTVARP